MRCFCISTNFRAKYSQTYIEFIMQTAEIWSWPALSNNCIILQDDNLQRTWNIRLIVIVLFVTRTAWIHSKVPYLRRVTSSTIVVLWNKEEIQLWRVKDPIKPFQYSKSVCNFKDFWPYTANWQTLGTASRPVKRLSGPAKDVERNSDQYLSTAIVEYKGSIKSIRSSKLQAHADLVDEQRLYRRFLPFKRNSTVINYNSKNSFYSVFVTNSDSCV